MPNETLFRPSLQLTTQGVLAMLQAAVAEAESLGQPQCIAIVDASGSVLAHLRMSGAKFLSMQSALAKARTAASINNASHTVGTDVAVAIAAATEGQVTRLAGGLPIQISGALLGGIGVGSGTPAQDLAVAKAALDAVGADSATLDLDQGSPHAG